MSRAASKIVTPLNDDQRSLVESGIALAHKIGSSFARQYASAGIDFSNEAMLALTLCGREFKSELDVPFKAFAATRIKLRMIDCLRVSGVRGYQSRDKKNRKSVRVLPFSGLANPNGYSSPEDQYEFIGVSATEQPDEREVSRDSILSLANRLPKRQRKVIILRYIDTLSFKEIGDQLGIPEGTANSHHRLAIAKLRKFLLEKKRSDDLSAIQRRGVSRDKDESMAYPIPHQFTEQSGEVKAALPEARSLKLKVKGVTWNSQKECWRVVFMSAGIRHDLGLFRDETEAITALEAARAGGPITRHKLGGQRGRPRKIAALSPAREESPPPIRTAKTVDVIHRKRWSPPPELETEAFTPYPKSTVVVEAIGPSKTTSILSPYDEISQEIEATKTIVTAIRDLDPVVAARILYGLAQKLQAYAG